MFEHFWDPKAGGLYFTSDEGTEAADKKEGDPYDSATPSGNSVAAFNLLRLGRMTAGPELERKAKRSGRRSPAA